MKKFFAMIVFSALLVGSVFAEPKNKIGVALGWPSGINYSRQVSDLIEVDLVAGFYYMLGPLLDVRVSPLFKIWNGPVGTVNGKFSLGSGFGLSIGSMNYDYVDANGHLVYNKTAIGGFNISLPLRFEFQFNVPFNLYLEATPIGVATIMYTEKNYNGNFFRPYWYYYWGAALGLRYSF